MSMRCFHIPTARDLLRDRVSLPSGVQLRPLITHQDARGDFTELFRAEWGLGPMPLQWNMVRSGANVLRGVHVHQEHDDYLTMVAGEMVLGLHDLRPDSPTRHLSVTMRLDAHDLHLTVIPVGVAHGFCFLGPACHVYAVTRPFDGSDEFGCRWNDRALGLTWPCDDPRLSERDRTAGSYDDMVAALGF